MQLLKGLKTESPKAADASTVPKGGSVDSDAVRSSPATQPKTIGPREA